jgi:hypothetical protein
MRLDPLLMVVPAAGILGVLAGCAAPSPDSGTPPTATVTVTASPSSEPDVLSGFLCSPDEDNVWRGKARLSNVGTATNVYTVRFSVVRDPGTDVVGMKEDTFTLDSGQSTDVAFPGIYTGGPDGLRCVPQVTARPAD